MLGLSLALLLCVSAMAQTTGIEVDGKTYTFTGGKGTYEADGKTFVIGADTVTIREAGKPDRVLPLLETKGTDIVQDTGAVFIEQGRETSFSSFIANAAMPITEYTQSSFPVDAVAGNSTSAATEDHFQFSYAAEDVVGANKARFDLYAKFGLSYDAAGDVLYYQGQRVRIFQDQYPLDEQSFAGQEHVDAQGVIDIKTQRDHSRQVYNPDGSIDPAGTLTGLYVLTDAEFAARNLSDWTHPATQVANAMEGAEMTPAEKQAFYAPYAAFGLTYDAVTDTLTYQSMRVRQMTDIRQSNGEPLESGRFQGVMTHIGGDIGDVDVQILRDYSKPDAAGDGLLIGIQAQKVR